MLFFWTSCLATRQDTFQTHAAGDPGHSTVRSLGQITIALLTIRPNIDRLVVSNMLLALENEIGRAFATIEERLNDQ